MIDRRYDGRRTALRPPALQLTTSQSTRSTNTPERITVAPFCHLSTGLSSAIGRRARPIDWCYRPLSPSSPPPCAVRAAGVDSAQTNVGRQSARASPCPIDGASSRRRGATSLDRRSHPISARGNDRSRLSPWEYDKNVYSLERFIRSLRLSTSNRQSAPPRTHSSMLIPANGPAQ